MQARRSCSLPWRLRARCAGCLQRRGFPVMRATGKFSSPFGLRSGARLIRLGGGGTEQRSRAGGSPGHSVSRRRGPYSKPAPARHEASTPCALEENAQLLRRQGAIAACVAHKHGWPSIHVLQIGAAARRHTGVRRFMPLATRCKATLQAHGGMWRSTSHLARAAAHPKRARARMPRRYLATSSEARQ